MEKTTNTHRGDQDSPAEAYTAFYTANVVVAGITGAGKSTLINAVSGHELAKTGTGRPITEQIAEYQSDDFPIRIWDTVGLELDNEKTTESINAIRTTIASKADCEDPLDHIHAIWYCINSVSSRYQGGEIEFIKSLHSIGVPFIIVLTKCSAAEDEIAEFENEIRKVNTSAGMDDIEIVSVCAKDIKLRGGFVVKAFGLEELVAITTKRMPDFIRGGFIAAQNVSKAQKRDLCEKILVAYVDDAIRGFWDKVPVVNFFTTDKKIHTMFSAIGKLYNSIIPENRIQEIIDHMGSMDLEHGVFGMILPISKRFDQKVDRIFDRKEAEGFSVPAEKLEKNERAARMLAYFGYLFLEAIEELWEEINKSKLEDIDSRVKMLKGIISEKFDKKARG